MQIYDIIRRLLVKYPMFGSTIANVVFKENNCIETACTDGETIYYNSYFLSNLNLNEQVFILAHEICHIALEHIYRSKNRDDTVWNIATDAVINANLIKDGLEFPRIGGVNIPEAINYDVEELYDKLIEQKNKLAEILEKTKIKSKTKIRELKKEIYGDNSPFSQYPHASHALWKEVVDEKEDIESKGQANNNLSEKDIFQENRNIRKKQLNEFKESLLDNGKIADDTPGDSYRDIGQIGISKPLIDWRRLLRETVNYKYDWSYKNATIENGVLTPNLVMEMVPEVEIVLDTSGSINEYLLKTFLRECKHILQNSRVKVGCFDTKFYGFHEIKNLSDIDKLKYEGGGGTNFEVAVNAFSRRVDNKIIFTDGYAPMPLTKVDAIWVVFGGDKISPLGGRVIYIDIQDLNKLKYNEINKVKKL